MRGAFIFVIVIALLIVGILVVKDMDSETADGVKRREAVEKAEDAAREVDKAMDRMRESAKQLEIPTVK